MSVVFSPDEDDSDAIEHQDAFGRDAFQRLGVRERQVVEMCHAGMTNQAIAQALAISPATVKNHLWRAGSVLGGRIRPEPSTRYRGRFADLIFGSANQRSLSSTPCLSSLFNLATAVMRPELPPNIGPSVNRQPDACG